MYTLDFKSSARLASCHDDLQKVVLKLLELMPIVVTCGHRGKDEQDRLYLEKKTQVLFPASKHNSYPSMAVDVAPKINGTIDWNDREQFTYMAGLAVGIAYGLGVKVRWGGDWNQDGSLKDNKFDDLPHLELV